MQFTGIWHRKHLNLPILSLKNPKKEIYVLQLSNEKNISYNCSCYVFTKEKVQLVEIKVRENDYSFKKMHYH